MKLALLIIAIVVIIVALIAILSSLINKDKANALKEEEKEDEEDKRKWADVNEKLKFVCEGGKVQCQFCSSPMSPIKVTSNDVMLQDKAYVTTADKDGLVNFNFMGVCNHPSQQKPSSPPPPCKAIIKLGQWKDFSETKINNDKALLMKSTIMCTTTSAEIKIIDSGQKAVLSELKPHTKREKTIEKIYWVNDDLEPIKTIGVGGKAHLYLETKGYRAGELVPFAITERGGAKKTLKWKADSEGKVVYRDAYISKEIPKEEFDEEEEKEDTNSNSRDAPAPSSSWIL